MVNWMILTNNTSAWYITIITAILTAIYFYLKNKNLPPGPIGLPFFGYWPFLNATTCHLQLQELGKKYGDIFSFGVCGRLYINLGSFKANREAFLTKSEYFTEKGKAFSLVNYIFKGSLLTLNGEVWRVNRKFFVQQFRERGMSGIKDDKCGSIYDAVQETVEVLHRSKGEQVDIVDMLTNKCATILFSTLFGESGISEREIKTLNEIYTEMMGNVTGTNFLLCGTFCKYFMFPFMKSFSIQKRNAQNIERLMQTIIDRHKETFDKDNIRNIIDAYLNEREVRQSKNDPTAEYFTDSILNGSMTHFIADGILSVAAFIGAFFYTLLEHPEEQDKIHEELMEVVGADRNPTLADKSKLPYTNAFISEMLRTSNFFPFAPSLECTREVTLGSYRIPKGAITLMNIWSSHFDSTQFQDPEKFNPSRFLVKEREKKLEHPIMFGIGKHSCIGEEYTLVQVFLYLTTIIKHFHLVTPTKAKEDNFLFFAGKTIICACPRRN